MSVTCCFFHVYSLEFIPWLYSSILPEDYVHVKEIITADATQIPVGDQITQPALRLLKILSQVFAIQRSFLKKNFWGLCTQHCFIFSSSFCCREVRNLQTHKEKRLREIGEWKDSPSWHQWLGAFLWGDEFFTQRKSKCGLFIWFATCGRCSSICNVHHEYS